MEVIEDVGLRNKYFIFKDRRHAGKLLGKMLSKCKEIIDIVLVIPSGGVPVGYEISKVMKIPLGLAIVKKIPIPYNPEAGYGAVAWNGEIVLNRGLLEHLRLSDEKIKEDVKEIKILIRKRMEKFGFNLCNLDIEGKAVIIVDDGLASGITMLTAIKAVRKYHPNKIIIAVPTALQDSLDILCPHVDKIYCLNIRESYPFAVADAYQEWHDLTDEEVVEILNMLRKQ